MRWAIALGFIALAANAILPTAASAKVVEDRARGELPTPSLLLEPKHPAPPRVEVIAEPAYRVKIDLDMNCRRGKAHRLSTRRIRTKPSFSRRFALPLARPDSCTIFVLATYADESELPSGYMRRGTIRLRVYL